MKYAIMTAIGFQMCGSEAAVYLSAEEAKKHMGPGDSLVPITERGTNIRLFSKDLKKHAKGYQASDTLPGSY